MPCNNPEDTHWVTSTATATTDGNAAMMNQSTICDVSLTHGSTCPFCGGFYIGSHACHIVDLGQPISRPLAPYRWSPPQQLAPPRPCEHCFCSEAPLATRPHEVCCMCATRRLKA